MEIRWGLVALVGLAAFIVMRILKAHKKAQYVGLTLVGIGAGGAFGEAFFTAFNWMESASSSSTAWAIGSGVGWFIALVVTLFYGFVMFPNRIEPAGSGGGKFIDVTMLVISPLAWPSIVATFFGLGAIVGV